MELEFKIGWGMMVWLCLLLLDEVIEFLVDFLFEVLVSILEGMKVLVVEDWVFLCCMLDWIFI